MLQWNNKLAELNNYFPLGISKHTGQFNELMISSVKGTKSVCWVGVAAILVVKSGKIEDYFSNFELIMTLLH